MATRDEQEVFLEEGRQALPDEGAPNFMPGLPLHDRLKELVRTRIDYAKRKYASRTQRWRDVEREYRAYIDVSAVDQSYKKKDKDKEYPGFAPLVIPLPYAMVHTMVTYLMSVFGARQPILQVEGQGPEDVKPAQAVETVLAYNMSQVTLALKLYYWFHDTLIYGVGWMKNEWRTKKEPRVVLEELPVIGQLMRTLGMDPPKQRNTKIITTFEGNWPSVSDPWRTYHDPRVPVSRAQDGEFICFVTRKSYNELLRDEESGFYMNVKELKSRTAKTLGVESTATSEIPKILGMPEMTQDDYVDKVDMGYPLLEEVWIKLVPSDYGLSEGVSPEVWVITLGNKETLIRAERMDNYHGEFPVDGLEYDPDVHTALNPGLIELVKPLNEHLSWLFNSHMENVKKAINDIFIYDPSRLVMEDMKAKGGARIRLLPAAYGTDVRSALTQLQIVDVTRNHMADAEIILSLLQRITGIADNFMGLPNVGGTKTATEVRGIQQMSGGRMKTTAELFYWMGLWPFVKKCTMNTQQYLSETRFYRIMGRLAKDPRMAQSLQVSPEDIIGNFDFPPVDGSFPVDKLALAQTWKEIFQAIVSIPQLLQIFDVVEVFQEGVRGMGVKNLEDFLLKPDSLQSKVMQQQQMMDQQQKGNMVPAKGPGAPRGMNAMADAMNAMRRGQNG